MRPFFPALVLFLSVGLGFWSFAGSSFGTGVAVTGALGAGLLGLAVFGRARRGPLWRGMAALVGAQFVYLALWIAGGLLWAGPPRSLPHFAAPLRLQWQELQGRWTGEKGEVYEVRGTSLCPLRPVELRSLPSEHPSPDPCLRLMSEGGRLALLVDDLALSLRAYRLWGREYLDAGLFDLRFSRPVPER